MRSRPAMSRVLLAAALGCGAFVTACEAPEEPVPTGADNPVNGHRHPRTACSAGGVTLAVLALLLLRLLLARPRRQARFRSAPKS